MLHVACWCWYMDVLSPSQHETSKQRPLNIHNVYITLCGCWNNVVCQMGYWANSDVMPIRVHYFLFCVSLLNEMTMMLQFEVRKFRIVGKIIPSTMTFKKKIAKKFWKWRWQTSFFVHRYFWILLIPYHNCIFIALLHRKSNIL